MSATIRLANKIGPPTEVDARVLGVWALHGDIVTHVPTVPMPLSWHGPLARLAKAHDTSISGVVRLALAEMLDVRVRVSKARGDLREQSPERRAQAELDNMKREERAQQRRDAAEIAASRTCPVCGGEPVARRRRMDEFDAACAAGHRWWQAVPGLAPPPPSIYDEVLSKRPSFTGGGTDSADYAWMVWRAGMPQTFGRVEVLAC